jgi:ADP-ribose pyrophosphatase YjhB (NUDIX family)
MSEPEGRLYPERPVVAASLALLRNGRALIARRARAPFLGVYSFPGGGVEIGETLREAALRELYEETGLKAEIVGFLDHVEPIVREGGRVRDHYVIACFVARWIGGEPRPGPELDDFAWVDGEAVKTFRTTPELPRLVAQALASTAVR